MIRLWHLLGLGRKIRTSHRSCGSDAGEHLPHDTDEILFSTADADTTFNNFALRIHRAVTFSSTSFGSYCRSALIPSSLTGILPARALFFTMSTSLRERFERVAPLQAAAATLAPIAGKSAPH